MTFRGLLARTFGALARAAEGQPRPGPWYLPVTGGWLPQSVGQYWNWWQLGYDPVTSPRSAIVEACVSAYSQTVAMCPGSHWRLNDKGGRDRVTNSALSRILRYPNAYQSISDFLLNLTRYLYSEGNAYAVALRNDRYEVDELHLMDSRLSRPMVGEDGSIFYQLGGNNVLERMIGTEIIAPARDVLHVRLHARRLYYPYPLMGESPLMAASADVALSEVIRGQQVNYFQNEARPSAVLSTDQRLSKEQVDYLQDRWEEKSKGMHAGGTPILTWGLKPVSWGTPAADAQIAELLKLSNEQVALVFRIPLQILGLGGAPLGSTESMMQFWIATGLGFALNHIEESIGNFFGLDGQPDDYVEFDTDALLRSALKDRIDALVKGIQGGLYAPNEARNIESLPDVKFGDEPRVQAQVIPLSQVGKTPPSSPPPPVPPSAPVIQPSKPDKEPPPKDYSDGAKRELERLRIAADRISGRLN
jgi:HK97 family phage portal protein